MALKYKTSAILEWLVFSALLGVATLFVWSVLTEYSAGKTYFSEPEFADIGQDAPTITLCWSAGLKLVYGKDYEWRVQHDGKFNTLHQGNNYVAFNEPVTNKSSQRMIYLRELMINYQDTDDNEFVMKPSCSSIGQDITSPGSDRKSSTIIFAYFTICVFRSNTRHLAIFGKVSGETSGE